MNESNFAVLELAAESLKELAVSAIFVGGQVSSLYHTDPMAPAPRITKDVDLLVRVITRADYAVVEESMRLCGYGQRIEEPVIIRWFGHGIIVDVIPTNSSIFGFEGRWLADSFDQTIVHTLNSGRSIRLLAPPNYLAAKFEAFLGRGQNDVLASHDFEDIVGIVAFRPEIVQEILDLSGDLLHFLKDCFGMVLETDFLEEAVEGCLASSADSQKRVAETIQRMRDICR